MHFYNGQRTINMAAGNPPHDELDGDYNNLTAQSTVSSTAQSNILTGKLNIQAGFILFY